MPGDHRTIWMDIEWTSIIGEGKQNNKKFLGRKLTLEDPRVISRYINKVKSEVKKGKIHARTQKLRKEIRDGQRGVDKEVEMEDIMEKLHRILEDAEEGCRKVRVGKRAFSLLIQSKRANVDFWQTAVKIKKGRGTPGRKLRTLYARMEEEYKKDIRDISLNKAICIKKKAKKDLEEISKTHIEAREKWKMELSEAKARMNKTSAVAKYKN